MLSEKYVRHEDGRHGVLISETQPNMTRKVVVCDTGQEEEWHYQMIVWVWLEQQADTNKNPT